MTCPHCAVINKQDIKMQLVDNWIDSYDQIGHTTPVINKIWECVECGEICEYVPEFINSY